MARKDAKPSAAAVEATDKSDAVQAFNFAPVSRTSLDLFAKAPEVKKMSRRDRQRLKVEELQRSVGSKKTSKEGAGEASGKGAKDDLFQSVFTPEDLEKIHAGEGTEDAKKKKGKKPPLLRHALHRNEEEEPRTIFVGNLPNTVDKREVEKIFKTCGVIESVRVRCQALEAPSSEKSQNVGRAVRVLRGEIKKDDKYSATAYVLFRDVSSIAAAVEKNGIVFKNRHLTVTTLAVTDTAYAPETSIFIGNVSYDTTEEDVWSFFQSHGITDIKRVRLIRDRDSGDCKGFGYVEFHRRASVQPAIDTRGNQLNGRDLRIVHVNKSKDVKAIAGSRREKRKTMQADAAPSFKRGREHDSPRGGKFARHDSPSGARKRTGEDTPSWMGVTTNPRRKMPRDLRGLVADGDKSRRPALRGAKAPVKHKLRNPERKG